MQYRQGPFGYTVLDELLASGHVNLAAADQVAALRWVNQAIGNFGGDARRVSLMGQSAGAGFVLWGALPGLWALSARALRRFVA